MINDYKKIHLIGIGGISMSAIAKYLIKNDVEVSGSDETESKITRELESLGVKVFYHHRKENITQNISCVVFSASIKSDNPEFLEAKKQNLLILERKDILKEMASEFEVCIAISGSHGKTTTTGLLSYVMSCAELPITAHIGGECKDFSGNLLYSDDRYLFITEACEYVDSFLTLQPNYSVILNIQPDHMDFFKTEDHLLSSFKRFSEQTLDFVFINFDDKRCRDVLSTVTNKEKYITFSAYGNESAEFYAKNIVLDSDGFPSFDCYRFNEYLGNFKIALFGIHNVYNALSVIAVSYYFGIDYGILKNALSTFGGIKRRYEFVGEINGAKVIHDYAHHPTEILKTIEETKVVTTGKVFVVFQPHTFSRTRDFLTEFVMSLRLADVSILYPIYPAREVPIKGITSYALSFLIREQGAESLHFYNFNDIYKYLKQNCKNCDKVLILGAGNIVDFCEYFN